MLALRAGGNPQALVTTTPRRVAVLKRILAERTTAQPPTPPTPTRPTCRRIPRPDREPVREYAAGSAGDLRRVPGNDRRGLVRQFDPARHVSAEAEYHPGYPVRCAIDAGTSRHTAAVFLQVRPTGFSGRPLVTVFADYYAVDVVSENNAVAIKEQAKELPCRGRIDLVRLDPAASARSSLGPAAYGEYERVFGPRIVARWPQHLVLDGLDTIELLLDAGNLLIHPRCRGCWTRFASYCKQRRGASGSTSRPTDILKKTDGRAPRRHPRRPAGRSRLHTRAAQSSCFTVFLISQSGIGLDPGHGSDHWTGTAGAAWLSAGRRPGS